MVVEIITASSLHHGAERLRSEVEDEVVIGSVLLVTQAALHLDERRVKRPGGCLRRRNCEGRHWRSTPQGTYAGVLQHCTESTRVHNPGSFDLVPNSYRFAR